MSGALLPPELFTHLELLRSGVGLVPAGAEQGSAAAVYVSEGPGSRMPLRSCTCADSQKRTCEPLRDLGRALGELQRPLGGAKWQETLAATTWYRLARILFVAKAVSFK